MNNAKKLKMIQLKTFSMKMREGSRLVQMKVENELHMMRASNQKIADWL
jgi:hypothetical protein